LADQTVRKEKHDLHSLREVLSVSNGDLIEKTEGLIEDRKRLLKEIGDLKLKLTSYSIEALLEKAESIDNFKLVSSRLNDVDSIEEMKKTGDLVRTKLKSGVGILGSIINDKPFLLCVVTEDLIHSKKIKAGDIIKILAKYINGGGGGKPHMAQAGGKDSNKLDLALKKAKETIESIL
jgi:alanyl-tRNA synthetase